MSVLATDTQVDPVNWAIYNAGAFGLFGLAWMRGWIHSDSAMKAKDRQIEYLEGQVRASDQDKKDMNRLIEALGLSLSGRALPAMRHANQVLAEIPETGIALQDSIHQIRDDVAKLSEQLVEMTVEPKDGS